MSDLDLLLNAARTSPPLRDAVHRLEAKLQAQEYQLSEAHELVKEWEAAWLALSGNPKIPDDVRAMMGRRLGSLTATPDDSQLGPPTMGDAEDEERRRAAYGERICLFCPTILEPGQARCPSCGKLQAVPDGEKDG